MGDVVPSLVHVISLPLHERYRDQTVEIPAEVVLKFMSDMGRVLQIGGDSMAYRSFATMAFAVEKSLCSNLKATNNAAPSSPR